MHKFERVHISKNIPETGMGASLGVLFRLPIVSGPVYTFAVYVVKQLADTLFFCMLRKVIDNGKQ